MKNSSDTIKKRTRDLPACSAVPQPNAPPRATVTAVSDINLRKVPDIFVRFLPNLECLSRV